MSAHLVLCTCSAEVKWSFMGPSGLPGGSCKWIGTEVHALINAFQAFTHLIRQFRMSYVYHVTFEMLHNFPTHSRCPTKLIRMLRQHIWHLPLFSFVLDRRPPQSHLLKFKIYSQSWDGGWSTATFESLHLVPQLYIKASNVGEVEHTRTHIMPNHTSMFWSTVGYATVSAWLPINRDVISERWLLAIQGCDSRVNNFVYSWAEILKDQPKIPFPCS